MAAGSTTTSPWPRRSSRPRWSSRAPRRRSHATSSSRSRQARRRGGGAGARWLVEHHKDLPRRRDRPQRGGRWRASTDDLRKRGVRSASASRRRSFKPTSLVVPGRAGTPRGRRRTGDPVVDAGARAREGTGATASPRRVLPETEERFAAEVARRAAYVRPRCGTSSRRRRALIPADEAVLSEGPGYNARLRTTCVTTMLKGSPQNNVLPTSAEATINCRILPGETRAQTLATCRRRPSADPLVSKFGGRDFGDGGAIAVRGRGRSRR